MKTFDKIEKRLNSCIKKRQDAIIKSRHFVELAKTNNLNAHAKGFEWYAEYVKQNMLVGYWEKMQIKIMYGDTDTVLNRYKEDN